MTNSDKNGLTDRQIKCLPYFVGNGSEKDMCKAAHVSRETYYTWLRHPQFRTELSKLRNLAVEGAIETLKTSASKAVVTLTALLDADSPSIQRAAVNDILSHIGRFIELKEIETRLQTLEETNNH